MSDPIHNNLRDTRVGAMMSRTQLVLRCKNLAETDPTRYVTVSESTVRDLENGQRNPRRNTASTLAAALGVQADVLFSAYDDTPRNPQGRTRIPSDRSRVGRPRKKPDP